MVAEAFIPNPENKPEVNHVDGNKLNNDVSNLEWNTSLENMHHAIKTELINFNHLNGESNGRSKLKDFQVIDIRKDYYINNKTQKEISEKFEINVGTISEIINFKLWSHLSEYYNFFLEYNANKKKPKI